MKHILPYVLLSLAINCTAHTTAPDSITSLDEIIVVGYGTQKKIHSSGAVKTINNRNLHNRPVHDLTHSLQGIVGGLNIHTDNGGAPDESIEINIRGVGSISDAVTATPLVLVDGMECDLAYVNPNDIESISVLKDASAAAIYGSRAPFGVILVTTKANCRETTINYSANIRVNEALKVPQLVDGYTYCLMMNEAWQNAGLGAVPYSQNIIDKVQQYQRGELKYATEATADGKDWCKQLRAFGSTDWYDVFVKKHTVSHEHNINISGSGENVGYYLSAAYIAQSGLYNYANESYNRLNISARFNIHFNRHAALTLISRLVNIDNSKPSVLDNTFYHNLSQRYVTDALILPTDEYSDKSLIPALHDGGRISSRTKQLHTQGHLRLTPLPDWNINIDVGTRIERNPYTRQFNPLYYTSPDGSQHYYPVREGVIERHDINDNGTFRINPAAGESYYEKANTDINFFSTNIYSDYSFSTTASTTKILVGMQTEYYRNECTRVATSSISDNNKPYLPSVRGDKTTMTSERKGEWSAIGFFARLNYGYLSRYLAEINLRADGSSRFPTNKRWGYFPSISAAWNIAQEPFWQALRPYWPYFKLRASYGTLGNQNTSSYYPYIPRMSPTSGSAVIGGEQTTVLPVYAPYSGTLTWERIETVNIGIDMSWFGNKLSAEADIYQRTTKDMIGPSAALPAIYGASAPQTNNASLRTRGWELELAWNDKCSDWRYGLTFSLSDYRSVVTKYYSPDNTIDGWYAGKRVGDIWGYSVVGIATSNAEMEAHLASASQSSIGTKWGEGDIMYADIDGNGTVDGGSRTLDNHGDLRVIGNNTPRLAFAFTVNAQWRIFDFRAFFQGIGKRDIAMPTNCNTFFGFNGPYNRVLTSDILDYYRNSDSLLGTNTDSYYGRLRTDANNRQVCDRFLQDGAYLRLKNLQIGISLPDKPTLKRYLKSARLYLSIENIFTLSHLRIFDPEAIGTGGYVGKTYPQYRTWTIGVEISI